MTLFVLLILIRFPHNGSLLCNRSHFPRPPRYFSFRKLKEDTSLGDKGLVMSLTPPPSPYSLHGLSGEAPNKRGTLIEFRLQVYKRVEFYKLRYMKGQRSLLFRYNQETLFSFDIT